MSMNTKKKISGLIAWQARSAHEQKRIAAFLLVLAIVLPLSVWFWINSASRQNLLEKDQIVQQYKKALPLATQVLSAEPDQTDFSGLSPLAAVQQIAREIGLEKNMTSIRPTSPLQGRQGVQIHLENLNLPQLLHLFASLKSQTELQLISGNLNKRADNPARTDLSVILSR
ncbi:MAG: type II secretion system protein GspM [Desulfonatronovibrio sp.]